MYAVGARTLEYLRGERDLFEERKQLAELRKKVETANLSYWMTGANKRRVVRFWQVVSLLQENSRMTLMEMSRKLKIPASTVFDTLKAVEKHFQFTIVLRDNKSDISSETLLPVSLLTRQNRWCEQLKTSPKGGASKEWSFCLEKAHILFGPGSIRLCAVQAPFKVLPLSVQ